MLTANVNLRDSYCKTLNICMCFILRTKHNRKNKKNEY